jgi:LPS-assembly protein
LAQGSLLFGRALRQTLEPRLLYVRTPYRRQDQLPNFDAFGKEFNFSSIYAANDFAGVDRVSDAHQLTLGATSRLIDPDNGAELLRVGVAQRILFRDQRVAPALDGSVDGEPLDQRFSDVLLLGSTTLLPDWSLDAALQFNQNDDRLRRSLVGARWSPGPFRTLNLRYRLARGLSEQVEAGWQWPVYRGDAGTGGGSGGGCRGTLYSVGRINFSLRDSRITDSVLGFEYDTGCWIGRIVAERLSTGRSEATTRLLLQLELVGLSRLGSNPLQVLKDNIPGYRLLRDERAEP